MKWLLMLSFSVITLSACDSSKKEDPKAASQPIHRESVTMDSDKIYNEALENPFAFEKNIAGKSIKLIGKIESIKQSSSDNLPLISFGYHEIYRKKSSIVETPNVYAILDSKDEASSLVVGESLIVECNKVDISNLTKYGSVRLTECKVDTRQK